MNKEKRRRLKSAGWRVGDVAEFLELSPAEADFVELKLALAKGLRARREEQGLTQQEVALRMGSSQSRVAKMEAADNSVSIDLLVRALLTLGATRTDLARLVRAGRPEVHAV
jgi:predicted XRE-type DNA-binding protein